MTAYAEVADGHWVRPSFSAYELEVAERILAGYSHKVLAQWRAQCVGAERTDTSITSVLTRLGRLVARGDSIRLTVIMAELSLIKLPNVQPWETDALMESGLSFAWEQILELAMNGCSAQQIATRLNLSFSQVRGRIRMLRYSGAFRQSRLIRQVAVWLTTRSFIPDRLSKRPVVQGPLLWHYLMGYDEVETQRRLNCVPWVVPTWTAQMLTRLRETSLLRSCLDGVNSGRLRLPYPLRGSVEALTKQPLSSRCVEELRDHVMRARNMTLQQQAALRQPQPDWHDICREVRVDTPWQALMVGAGYVSRLDQCGALAPPNAYKGDAQNGS
ncbi:MAG TPA: hypothetical protein VLI05_02880 [Candidatus Saccharimonadia bacterium]|nr:hypothetical protein [Candidatus Saccharimonadia bacterium]